MLSLQEKIEKYFPAALLKYGINFVYFNKFLLIDSEIKKQNLPQTSDYFSIKSSHFHKNVLLNQYGKEEPDIVVEDSSKKLSTVNEISISEPPKKDPKKKYPSLSISKPVLQKAPDEVLTD